VLGANDGIVSTASLMVGVAAAASSKQAVLLAGIAGLVAGALSMAAGEYVSVSSQKDSEQADLEIEKLELEHFADDELDELRDIYISRGLSPKLAKTVAQELHDHDPLGAHARDELGIDRANLANPWQAAWASALSFSLGAALPILAAVSFNGQAVSVAIVGVSLIALALSGAIGAYVGGGSKLRAALRVFLGGAAAMAITALIGKLVGASL
jgi:vacuolar iron transporter family protein